MNRVLCTIALVVAPLLAVAADTSFIGPMHVIKAHASTVPAHGDVNPYGVAVVPVEMGQLHAGHILVSNFNDAGNIQGTGTTIVQVSPGDGSVKLFAQIDPGAIGNNCPGGIGLTTALVALRSGWVIVGSLPTTTSMGVTTISGPGCLLVINSSGQVAEEITENIDGPWDMTALDNGSTATLFISNVLTGSILRMGLTIPSGGMPAVSSAMTIAAGFPEHLDPAALIVGPTGVGLGNDGTLYVADTVDSAIIQIPNATGAPGLPGVLVAGIPLNGPLGLAIAPDGDIVTVNAGDGNMVEVTTAGSIAAVKAVDVTNAPGGGTLFGLAIRPDAAGVYFVNDGNNTLDLLH